MSMNASQISAIQSTSSAAFVSRSAPAGPAAAARDTGESVSVDTMPSSPPPEVLDAIANASESFDRLAAVDRRLHFHVEQPTGRVSVQVHDTQGNVLGTLSPSQALEVADGGTLRDPGPSGKDLAPHVHFLRLLLHVQSAAA